MIGQENSKTLGQKIEFNLLREIEKLSMIVWSNLQKENLQIN
jgi:hypothetical protein